MDAYFSSNTRLLAVRAVAKKYVDAVFAKCECDMKNQMVNYPVNMSLLFTLGELNIINVFRKRSCWQDNFDENGKAISEKMDEHKKEIDLGLWDTYLFWDWESYQNMQNQNTLAMAFFNLIQMNVGKQNMTNLDDKQKEK